MADTIREVLARAIYLTMDAAGSDPWDAAVERAGRYSGTLPWRIRAAYAAADAALSVLPIPAATLADPIVAVSDQKATGWQPIETAPRDGTEVDLWFHPYTGRCRRLPDMWWNPRMGWRNGSLSTVIHGSEEGTRITHWRPIPGGPCR